MAAADTAITVDWLVDCGMPKRLATRSEMDTENKMMDTMLYDIILGSSKSFPRVVAVAFPAIRAPKNTMIPNKPAMALRRMAFAPKAAEKEGPVPLPPMLMAKNMATRKGISK